MKNFGAFLAVLLVLFGGYYLLTTRDSASHRVSEGNTQIVLEDGTQVSHDELADSILPMVAKTSVMDVDDAALSMDEATMKQMADEMRLPRLQTIEIYQPMPVASDGTEVKVLAQGNFMPRAHEVSGKAKLVSYDGKLALRFEDFTTINGPDLRIYLASSLGLRDAVFVSKIMMTQGDFNYELDPSLDTSKYNKVLVWSEPFSVLFSFSELK